MNGPEFLQSVTGKLETSVGACFPGENAIFRGEDLHKNLRGVDWIGLYAYGILGRRLNYCQIEMINAIWVNTSYPDARLWNNRVAALSASARSSANLGMVAGLAVSDAQLYGGIAGARAFEFLKRAATEVEQGNSLEAIVHDEIKIKGKRISGFGRPINSHDERLPWIFEIAKRLGYYEGEHIQLALEVEKILVRKDPKLRMNYAAVHAAFIADMGLTFNEYQLIRIPIFLAGMAPCVIEAMEKPEGALFPTPCTGVSYAGVPRRSWDR